MIVADANMLAYLWLPSEFTDLAEKVLEADKEWIAPLLWKSEVRNVFSLYIRKNIISLPEALQCLEMAEWQMRDREFQVNSIGVLRHASHSQATAYDCEYICLAEEKAIPLVTNDRKLQENFPDIALSPLQFLEE